MTEVVAFQTLYGRNAEIETITAFLFGGIGSAVGALILSGEVGVGKSALLDEAGELPRQRASIGQRAHEQQPRAAEAFEDGVELFHVRELAGDER